MDCKSYGTREVNLWGTLDLEAGVVVEWGDSAHVVELEGGDSVVHGDPELAVAVLGVRAVLLLEELVGPEVGVVRPVSLPFLGVVGVAQLEYLVKLPVAPLELCT